MELLNNGIKADDVAETVGVSKGTVSKWKKKYGNLSSKYKLVETKEHLVFADETGRRVTDYNEWKQAYNKAVNAGVILF